MMAFRWAVAVLAMGSAVPVWGQQTGELRKCVLPNGTASFQQAPCAPGSRQVSTRAYVAEPPLTAAQLRARSAREQAGRAESAELSRRAGTVPGRSGIGGTGTLHRVAIARDDAACQRARKHREQTLAAVGLKRTYDLLRILNDEVARACR